MELAKVYDLNIDSELEALCPALSPDELALLEKSILDDGCRDVIVLWANHDKTIIDGHNRYRICREHKKDIKTKSLSFETKDEVKAWMLRNQMGRRNLTDSQRGMAAARLAKITHGGDRSEQAANLPLETQASAAEKFGVSERTVRSAKVVESKGTPELQKAVTDGKVAVSTAAVVAKLPAKEQKKVVAKGPEAVKAKAKEVKEAAKISGGVTFDVEEIEAADVAPVLGPKQAPYDTILNCITQIKKIWNELTADERDGVYCVQKRQRVLTLLDELRPPIAQARPMKVCTFCNGKGCQKCQGCGWWPRSVVEGQSR